MRFYRVLRTPAAIAAGVFFLLGCVHTQSNNVSQASVPTVAHLNIANPSAEARQQAPVYISFYDLGLDPKSVQESHFVVSNATRVLPSQSVDSDGNGEADSLLVLADFAPGQRQSWKMALAKARSNGPKVTQAEVSRKVQGEWGAHPSTDERYKAYQGGVFENVQTLTTPDFYTDHSEWIRYEGPGLESNLVGYRIYLDHRNGFDIFGKRVAEPVLQHIGQDGYESYHHMQPWGQDILKVGSSLGAGGFGVWANGQLIHPADVKTRRVTITDNGPLQSGFKIDYQGWQTPERVLDVSAHMTITAHSRLVKNTLTLSQKLPHIAIGVVDHPGTQLLKGETEGTGGSYSYLATWGNQSLAGDQLGIAVFFKTQDFLGHQHDGKSHIALLTPKDHEVHYYFAAYWQGELGEGIDSAEAFEEALQQQARELSLPLRQQLKTAASVQALGKVTTAEQALAWSKAMGESELARKTLRYHADGWDVNRERKPKFEYDIVGLLPYAYDELYRATGDATFGEIKHLVTGSFINDDGSISAYDLNTYNIDAILPGRVLLRLYQQTGEPKYQRALDTLREQLRTQPKTTNGAYWHKKRYPGQLWLDGVYMGMPFLAEYTQRFESGRSLHEVIQEFKITHQVLKDANTGLYYHGWDETKNQTWADADTGLSSQFWARGMGWMAMALVDVLDYIPQDHRSDRAFLEQMVVEVANTLKTYRDPSGTWWQILDQSEARGNYRESSASAMFTYFFAKAINRGYLTRQNFTEDPAAFALSSYQGLLSEFILVHKDGKVSMTQQCHVAGLGYGRDGSYDYYMSEPIVRNDPKGTGPFMLAGIEIAKMLEAVE